VKINTARAVEALIDNNVDSADITTSHLFYGAYSGNLPTTSWGVYIASNVKNHFEGEVNSNAKITGQRLAAGYDSGISGSVNAANWFRSSGSNGWYNATYGGGIYMTDNTWVRVYNGKSFRTEADLYVGGTITEASDKRLKENVEPLDNALSKVISLEGVRYNKIDTPEKEEIGFIAQDVEEIVPELVSTGEDGMKSVAYQRTVALLVEAMKEQQKTINNLEDRISKLEGDK